MTTETELKSQGSPFRAGTGMLGATDTGQQVTKDNAHFLPPGSVVRLDDDNGVLIHLHDDLWYWRHDCAWCYGTLDRFLNRLPGTLCHLPVRVDHAPNSLKWTKEPLTKDGYYWMRFADPPSEAMIVELNVMGGLRETGTVGEVRDRVDVSQCEFLGPITPHCAAPREQELRPRIICLCGSTRFVDTWIGEYQRLSDEGNIVLTVARMPPRPNLQYDEPELKQRLDELHKRKIDLADEVFVLDVDGYIGASTRSEIEYAATLGKPIRYLSNESNAARAVLATTD